MATEFPEICCVLIHPGRVGSTALCMQLSSLNMVIAGEIFNPAVTGEEGWPQRVDYVSFLRERLSLAFEVPQPYSGMRAAKHDASGYLFEYKPHHPGCDDPLDVAVQKFADEGVSHFVYLGRRNYLRRYVSYLVALSSGIWHTRVNTAMTQVRIDITRVSDFEVGFKRGSLLQALDHYYGQFVPAAHASISDLNSLELVYEDDVDRNSTSGFERMNEFLGLPQRQPAACQLVRQNYQPLSQLLSNYEEVANYLQGTPYRSLLDE